MTRHVTRVKPSTPSAGCILGVMPQALKAAKDGLEKAVLGTDPQQAMSDPAKTIRSEIEKYNSTVKK